MNNLSTVEFKALTTGNPGQAISNKKYFITASNGVYKSDFKVIRALIRKMYQARQQGQVSKSIQEISMLDKTPGLSVFKNIPFPMLWYANKDIHMLLALAKELVISERLDAAEVTS